MTDILRDLSADCLVAAIEENLFSLMPALSRWPRAQVHDEANVKWSITDIPWSLFNSIMNAQLAPQEVDSTVESIVAEAKKRSVPLLWWTGPSTLPADLGRQLEMHGFVDEGAAPGMAIDLEKLNEDLQTPDGLTVGVVRDAASLTEWGRTCSAGFGLPAFTGDAFVELIGCVEPGSMIAYLARLDGRPVATSLVMFAAGVAGIYNVATIPEARRRGIGAAVTLAPLQAARDQGYRVGILQASNMGTPVYRSLGFKEYCKIGMYGWEPTGEPGAA